MNMMMWNNSFKQFSDDIKPLVKNNNEYWTGKQVFSTILPPINLINKDIKIKMGHLESKVI